MARDRSAVAAMPSPCQGPQLMLSTGRPVARAACANASRNWFAAAYEASSGAPRTLEIEEKATKKSSGRSRVSRCRTHVPATFGRRTASSASSEVSRKGSGVTTPAAWMTPRSGGSRPRT